MSSDDVLVMSNKVNVSEEYTNVVEIAGNQAQNYQYSADNTDYSGTIQWNSIVPIGSMSNTLVSRVMKIKYQVRIVVTAVAAGTNRLTHIFPQPSILVDSAVASIPNSSLRAFPLQSISQNVQLSLNNCTTTWNARQTISPLLRLLEKDLLVKCAASGPTRPDDQFLLVPNNIGVNHPQSTAVNSLEGYSRNSIKPVTFTAAGNAYTWTFDVEEPLIFPGVSSLRENEPYLPNINQLGLILTYSNLQTDLFSSSPGYYYIDNTAGLYNDVSVVVTILNPKLCLSYMQVDPNLIRIPRQLTTSYESVTYFTSKSAVVVDLTNAANPVATYGVTT